MAEETKEKLLEFEAVRDRVESLKKSVSEMAEYIGVDARRKRLAQLEAQQAEPDFWNNQAKAKEVIAATNAERLAISAIISFFLVLSRIHFIGFIVVASFFFVLNFSFAFGFFLHRAGF